MRHFSRYHRTCAVMLASLGATVLALVLAGAPAMADAKIRMADAFLVDSTGQWFCTGSKVDSKVDCDPDGPGPAPQATSQGFAEELLKPGVLNKGRLYLRAAKARNDCHEGTDCATTVGVPTYMNNCQSAASNTPFCALLSLKRKNVNLGIVISAKRDDPDDPSDASGSKTTPHRRPSALAWQACEIRQADQAHLYDFVFIDYTFQMGYGATREAVQMIQKGLIIKGGKSVKCRSEDGKDLGRWPHVMTNDTTWNYKTKDYSLKTGAWAHAKRLGVIGEDHKAATRKSVGDGFTANDRQFIKRVHQANSQPVLRLEVTPDTSELAGLARPLQCSLLNTWAGKQHKLDYTLLFPLFVHGVDSRQKDGPHTAPYNSLLQTTFKPQLSLIAHPNKPSGCAATTGPPELLVAPGPPPVASTPPVGSQPPPPPVVAMPNVLAHEPTNLTCHSARLNGWVNPHGSPTRFHFEYWKRGDPGGVQPSGDGDAGAGTARVEIARVIDGLVRNTGYTGRLVASNAGGRAVSDIFSFTTPGC